MNSLQKVYFIGKACYLFFLLIMSFVIFNRINKAKYSDHGFLFISIILFLLYILNAVSMKGLYLIIFKGEGLDNQADHYRNVEQEEEDVEDTLRIND